MKYVLKGFLWGGILLLAWNLGIYLMGDFVFWKILLFFILARGIGHMAVRAFRWIDERFG